MNGPYHSKALALTAVSMISFRLGLAEAKTTRLEASFRKIRRGRAADVTGDGRLLAIMLAGRWDGESH